MTNGSKGFLLILSLWLVSGCEPGNTTPNVTSTTVVDAPAGDGATEADDVELSILNFDEIQQLLADKKGKVVVVDAWSTACPPCMKDFHNLVQLHKEYGPDKLACISLSFDYEGIGKPEDVRDPVLGFLRSQGATFDNVMSNEESDALYRKFDLNSVPAIFVYDQSGTLRERFLDEGAYEKVRPMVAELIANGTPANDDQP